MLKDVRQCVASRPRGNSNSGGLDSPTSNKLHAKTPRPLLSLSNSVKVNRHQVLMYYVYHHLQDHHHRLDDHTYFARSFAFAHLGPWRKLYDYSLLHFIISQCTLKCARYTFSSTFNRLAEGSKGEFLTPRFGGLTGVGIRDRPIRLPADGFLSAPR